MQNMIDITAANETKLILHTGVSAIYIPGHERGDLQTLAVRT